MGAFEWSPDGASIAFTSTGPESKAKKDRKEKYGDFEIVERRLQHEPPVVDQSSGRDPARSKAEAQAEALTKGDKFSVGDFAWSPDSKRIAFSARAIRTSAPGETSDIYVVDLADKYVKKLVETQGPDRNPMWSPDGSEIAYSTSQRRQEFFFYANTPDRDRIPADGGKPRILTQTFDEDPDLIDWGSDGIYFRAQQKTAAHLFRLDPASSQRGSRERAGALQPWTASRSPRISRRWRSRARLPNQFRRGLHVRRYSISLPNSSPTSADQWKEFQSRHARSDPVEIDRRHHHRRHPDQAGRLRSVRKYPLLVVIHGGPTGVDTPVLSPDRYYPVERFAAKGALVLKPNYRGSAGLRREVPRAERAQSGPGRLCRT